jgi:hypothetical protein
MVLNAVDRSLDNNKSQLKHILPSVSRVVFSGWAYRAVRWALACVFIYAGAMKLTAPQSFAVIIEAYGLLPIIWVDYIAVGLPTIEIIAAMALLFDIRGSLALITLLLTCFMLILLYGVWMGFDLNCGCFKSGDSTDGIKGGVRSALLRDAIMLAAICYLYLWRFKKSAHPLGFEAIRHKLLYRAH